MLFKRIRISHVLEVGLLVILAGLAMNTAVQAECQPGQMQEANLAYQTAEQSLAAEQWEQAISRLQSITEVCPEHVEATRGLGTAYAGLGDHEKAISWFRKVVTLRGDLVEAGDFANLAKAFASLKQYKEARAEYMKAEKLAPDDCGVLFNLGVLHGAAGYHELSVQTLEHALEVCPQIQDHILAQLSKAAEKAAAQQKKLGNPDKAAQYQELVSKYGGQAGGSTTYDLVKQKMKQQEFSEAIKLLEQMLAKDPNQGNALLTLARARDAVGNKTQSIEAYRKYLALKPQDSNAQVHMIIVMAEAGRCGEAKAAASDAKQKFASQGSKAMGKIYYASGMAYECAGEYQAAQVDFQQCAASGDSEWSSRGREQISRMDDFMAYEKAKEKKARQGG